MNSGRTSLIRQTSPISVSGFFEIFAIYQTLFFDIIATFWGEIFVYVILRQPMVCFHKLSNYWLFITFCACAFLVTFVKLRKTYQKLYMYLDEINLDTFVHSTTLIRMNGKLTLSLFLSISLSFSLNFFRKHDKKTTFLYQNICISEVSWQYSMTSLKWRYCVDLFTITWLSRCFNLMNFMHSGL